MRLSLGRLGLPFARGGAWTPAKLASLGAYWWRADRGVSLREAGPDWPSQGSHVRGLSFDGSTNYVDLGDNALYDNTAIAASYTFLVHIDTNEISANGYVYSEGRSSSATPFLGLRISTSAQLTVFLRDDSNTLTANKTVSLTDEAWSVVTVVFDAAGMGIVVNGTASLALGTAYDNTPATTTLNLATIGALRQASLSSYFTGPVAYGMRHDSALTLAQCRQVQQYIAEQVAGDGITLTIAGSETANANSPLNHWPFSEDAAGAEVADIAGSVTGVRQPGDRVSAWADSLQSGSFSQATTSAQPKFLATSSALNSQPVVAHDGVVEKLVAAALTIAQPLTVLAVLANYEASGTSEILLGANAADTFYVRVSTGSPFPYTVFAGTARAADAPPAAAHSLAFVGNADSSSLRTNGGASSLAAGTIGAASLAAPATGFRNAGAGQYGRPHIAELVIVPAALDTATMNKWLAYVERRWGLAYTEAT